MKDEMNMSTPVTRGELRDELEHFRQDLKRELATKQELEHAVSQLATKQELEHAVSQLATKQELGHAVSQLATKQELGHALEMWGGALLARLEPLQGMEQRLLAELARHTKASQESSRKRSLSSTRSTLIYPAA
jgi:hypothetical protein